MPPQTVDAFRDHGTPALTVTRDVEASEEVLRQLASIGIDMDAVTDDLLAAGVKSFADSFEKLLSGLAAKVQALTPA
jgi:transaldolase